MLAATARHCDIGAPVDELPFASRLSGLAAFVYVIRCYVGHGVDVAVWERGAQGDHRRFVYATGQIRLVPGSVGAAMEPEDLSLTRSERIRRRLEASLDRESILAGWSQIMDREDPLADSESPVSEESFLAAVATAAQFHPGCAVLGADSGFRVIARMENLSIDCDTCQGTGDPDSAFTAVLELLRKAGIDRLPPREFSL